MNDDNQSDIQSAPVIDSPVITVPESVDDSPAPNIETQPTITVQPEVTEEASVEEQQEPTDQAQNSNSPIIQSDSTSDDLHANQTDASTAYSNTSSIDPGAPPITINSNSSAQTTSPNFIHSLLIKAQSKIQSNKRKKLDKVMTLAQKKGKISNEDVIKLLRVSDPTATRYLSILVKEGRLSVSGHTRDLRYLFIR